MLFIQLVVLVATMFALSSARLFTEDAKQQVSPEKQKSLLAKNLSDPDISPNIFYQ